MSQFSDFMEEDVLDRYFGQNASLTIPATLWIGLATASISDSDDGSTVTEPADGYGRVSISNDKTSSGWTAATQVTGSAEVENQSVITFPEATGSWGTVTDFFVATAETGGEILAYGVLDNSKTVETGDTAEFEAGDLKIRLD